MSTLLSISHSCKSFLAFNLLMSFDISIIFYLISVVVMLLRFYWFFLTLNISLSQMSSKLTDMISGSSVSTIPTRSIFGNTRSVGPLPAFSIEPSKLKFALRVDVVMRPSHFSLFVMWSIAAFEGAQIRIFLFYSAVQVFFKYSYSAANKPINVVVFPVPGGPCKSTIPDSLSTISLIDSYWVELYWAFIFYKIG